MGKVKTELLTDYGCVRCDTLYPRERAALGYQTCTDCGEVLTKQNLRTYVRNNRRQQDEL